MTTEFVDNDGTTRLTGQLVVPGATPGDVLTVQADESVAPAAGGGSQPQTEHLSGNSVNIANAGNALLEWGGSNGPDTLLDLSVPTQPTVITAGFYIVTVPLAVSALTAAGTAQFTLTLDPDTDTWAASILIAAPTVNGFLAISGEMDAGDKITIRANNNDGAAARDFLFSEAAVMKIA